MASQHRMDSPAEARQVALGLFEAVMSQGLTLQDSIEADARYPKLEPRDRRFCHRLVAQALRHHGEARATIMRHLKTFPRGRQSVAGLILIMAAAELMTGDAKPHAVVDQSVRLARLRGCGHLGGLINAVLRKIAPSASLGSPILNLPDWLKDALVADWGEAETQKIAAMLMLPPPLDLRPKSDNAETLAEALGGCVTPLGSVRLNEGMVTSLAGYDEGAWWVQDAAASLPVMLLAPKPHEVIVDLCAAPGGKTAQIAAAGAKVLAVDASAARMQRLKANMQRLGLNAETIIADGMTWLPHEKVDRVLLDAPCSATGVIRRRPDILCRRKAPDLEGLNHLQRGLFEQAAKMLKPGGVLVYATCSLLKAEGEAIAAAPPRGLVPMPISDDEISGFKRCPHASAHTLRLMPDALEINQRFIQGNDGFFIARFAALEE